MLETFTMLHLWIPALLKANSKDAKRSLWLPTPLVRKKNFGIIESTSLKRLLLGFRLSIERVKLSCGDPFHYRGSFLLEDAVTAESAFYSSTAQLKFFCFNFGAAFYAFISNST